MRPSFTRDGYCYLPVRCHICGQVIKAVETNAWRGRENWRVLRHGARNNPCEGSGRMVGRDDQRIVKEES